MALSLFKKPTLVADDRPALAALRSHLAEMGALHERRVAINARITGVLRERQQADRITADIAALQSAIDCALADAAYNAEPELPLHEERKRLAALETALKSAAESVRRNQSVVSRLQADATALIEKHEQLVPEKHRLMFGAAREVAASHRDEYMQAVDNMRNVAGKVFAALEAADFVAMTHKCGDLSFAIQYLATELRFPTVLHPVFQTPSLTPEAREQIWIADMNAVRAEAEALVQRLSVGEA